MGKTRNFETCMFFKYFKLCRLQTRNSRLFRLFHVIYNFIKSNSKAKSSLEIGLQLTDNYTFVDGLDDIMNYSQCSLHTTFIWTFFVHWLYRSTFIICQTKDYKIPKWMISTDKWQHMLKLLKPKLEASCQWLDEYCLKICFNANADLIIATECLSIQWVISDFYDCDGV